VCVLGVQRGAAGAVPLDGLERLRGGAGLAKKLGLKNVGMLMVCALRYPAPLACGLVLPRSGSPRSRCRCC